MKPGRDELILLRWNVLALCMTILMGGGLSYIAGARNHQSLTALNNAQTTLDRARARLQNARTEQENLNRYAESFSALKQRGIFGEELRLNWLEDMNALRRQSLVPNFRYTIAPQTLYTPLIPVEAGNFELHYSPMKLELELLHEGQLLNFFAALREQVSGWYQLESCTLKRVQLDNETPLQAECGGGWITLKNRGNTPP
jgi:hypothetical protein